MPVLRVIADLHGRQEQFEQLLRHHPDLPLILLGDLIGYRDSVGTARLVLQLVRDGRAIALRGNWEDLLHLVVRGQDREVRSEAARVLVSRGGKAMLESFFADRPTLYHFLDLIEEMPLWHYDDATRTWLSHSGVDAMKFRPGMTIEKFARTQTPEDLLWSFDCYSSWAVKASQTLPFTVVSGHVPIDKLHDGPGPFRAGNLVGVDFGAASRWGRVGMVVIPSGEYMALPVS